jgi:signal transduction histidine kinase
VWNKTGARLAIEIRPHFYQTGWFAALCVLALGLAVYGGYRWRLRYLEARQRELEKLIAEHTAQLRESEESLRQLNEDLEQRVLERTDELQASRGRLRALSAHLQSLCEQERVTIARDLHDELGQVLTSLKMDMSMLERKAKSDNGKIDCATVMGDIETIQERIAGTIKQVRTLITELRPEVLDTLGLLPALEWQLEEFRKHTGLACEFHSALKDLEIAKEHAVAIFRIFQESLANIARHAEASQVKVKIEKSDHVLWVEIADDGKGISAEELNAPDKFGLLDMRERALVFGGEVEITGAPGCGTTVKIKVPLP